MLTELFILLTFFFALTGLLTWVTLICLFIYMWRNTP